MAGRRRTRKRGGGDSKVGIGEEAKKHQWRRVRDRWRDAERETDTDI